MYEVVAVLAVIGVAAGVGFYVASRPDWRCAAAANDVAMQLELARARAVFDRNDYVITFADDGSSFSVLDDKNSDGDWDAGIGETLIRHYPAEAGEGVVFGAPESLTGIGGETIDTPFSFPGTPPTLTFTPLGTGTAGSVYLIAQEDLERGERSHMRAISISRADGRVRGWRYDEKATGPGPWRPVQ